MPESSATPADDSAIRAKMDADKQRLTSVSGASILLGYDRATITKWLKGDGCPCVQKADKSLGHDWILDISVVVRWLQERAASDAVTKFGASDTGKMTEAEARRLSAIAKAIIQMKEAAVIQKAVVEIDYARERVSSEYAAVVAVTSVIPDMIAGKVDPAIAVKARKIADEQVRIAHGKLTYDKELSPPWTPGSAEA
ncbi:terminase small subunit [Neorhizobium tomejilense]